MLYLNNLIDDGFVNVGKCNFLSKEFHIHRGQGLAGRMSPPVRKLREEESSKLNTTSSENKM